MRALRRLFGSRAHAAAAAILALALQAGSSGYVPACPMKSASKATMSAQHACCQKCHMGSKTARKACCYLGVLMPCADGAVSESKLPAPTSLAAVVVTPAAQASWAALAVPISTAAPPIPTASPPRTSILLI